MIDYLTPVRERYQELRDDEAGLERTLAERRREGPGDRAQTLADVRAGDGGGSGPRRASSVLQL